MKKVIYIVAGTFAALLVVAMVGTAWKWPMIAEVETGATSQYPEIQPQYYSTEPERILEELVDTVAVLEKWRLVDEAPAAGRILARRSSSMWGLDADITIRVEPVTDFVAQVHVHSQTEFDRTDFGQNARNIEELFLELDDRLGAVRFEPQRGGEEPEEDLDLEPAEEPGEG